MKRGTIVVVHLQNPSEKYWGVLEEMAAHGVTLRCLNVESFDDWTRSVLADDNALGLATIFFPMFRVERVFLDERVGEVDSMRGFFETRVGRSIEDYLREIGVVSASGSDDSVN